MGKQWGEKARADKGKGGRHAAPAKWGESKSPKPQGLLEWIFGPAGKHSKSGFDKKDVKDKREAKKDDWLKRNMGI